MSVVHISEESNDDEMDQVLSAKVQFLKNALKEEIQQADSEFLEMEECHARLSSMRHASKAGNETTFSKLRDELGAFVQSRQERASPSSTCQSRDHGFHSGFHVADHSPKAGYAEKDEVSCDQYTLTFN